MLLQANKVLMGGWHDDVVFSAAEFGFYMTAQIVHVLHDSAWYRVTLKLSQKGPPLEFNSTLMPNGMAKGDLHDTVQALLGSIVSVSVEKMDRVLGMDDAANLRIVIACAIEEMMESKYGY